MVALTSSADAEPEGSLDSAQGEGQAAPEIQVRLGQRVLDAHSERRRKIPSQVDSLHAQLPNSSRFPEFPLEERTDRVDPPGAGLLRAIKVAFAPT